MRLGSAWTLIAALVAVGCSSSDDGSSSNAGGSAGTGAGTATGGGGGSGGSATGRGGSGGGTSGGGGSGGSTSLPAMCDGKPLTQWEQMMLDKHNEWRAAVTPPAANMYRVYWDKAIATNAANWVSSCDPDWPHSPDSTRKGVGGYDELGENLSYCAGTGCTEHPEITDGSGKGDGEGWWDERHDYNWANDSSSGLTSHYTQMVSSNIYGIGCATQKCGAPGPNGWSGDWWWTICQYGPRGTAYWVGNKPYEAGSGGLVEPPASVFKDHPGLVRHNQVGRDPEAMRVAST